MPRRRTTPPWSSTSSCRAALEPVHGVWGWTGHLHVPDHIFSKVDDWSKFTFYDPEKGWPISTTQWKVVHTSPQQKLIDRKDSWWAAERG